MLGEKTYHEGGLKKQTPGELR